MTSVHPWDDSRIIKQASSLAGQYHVQLHAPGNNHLETINGIDIHKLPDTTRRFLRPFNWVRLMWRGLKARACVYHFHDPELIPLGLMFRALGKKVIYDIHEDYRDSILHKHWIPLLARKLISNSFNLIEKNSCRFFNALVFAETTYKRDYLKINTLKEDILNYPHIPALHKKTPGIKAREKKTVLLYCGKISETRGILQMIETLYVLANKDLNVHLLLVGAFTPSSLDKKIEQLIVKYKLQERVTITGRITSLKLDNYFTGADVGLALLHPIQNTVKSMPTKLFEYMAYGIPVVISDIPAWKKLIDDTGAGFSVSPYSVKDISSKIEYVINNPVMKIIMGEKGREACLTNFNWQSEEKKLIDLYEKLTQNKRQNRYLKQLEV